jgi:hypothetical protein
MFALKFLENLSYISGDVSFLNIGLCEANMCLCCLNISTYRFMFCEYEMTDKKLK